MNLEFTPRYPGHEPPSVAGDLARIMESRLETASHVRNFATTPLAPPPPDPEPKKARCYQPAKPPKITRPAVKRAPRLRVYPTGDCTHAGWRRVMGSRTQVRCKRCGMARTVTESEQDALCPQARPGGQQRLITHGTRTGYFRGCRCEECKNAESVDRRRRYREANPVQPKAEVYRPAPEDCAHQKWWQYRRRQRRDGTLAVRVQCRSCGVTRTCTREESLVLCSGENIAPEMIPPAYPNIGRPYISTVHGSHAMYRRGCRCKECVEFTRKWKRTKYAEKLDRPVRAIRRAV